MSLRVTFLGTSGAVPTPERAPSAVQVSISPHNREADRLLFDCGEGTQRQMMTYAVGFDVSHVFVTHLHGDHVLGLPGLIQSWDFNEREAPLAIHVPPNARGHIEDLVHAIGHRPDFPVRIDEVAPGEVALDADGYEVRAFRTDHRTRSQGYALVEEERPGRFDRERAEELGIPVGPKFSQLHSGEPVELEDGTVVRPEQVVGDPRPGRTFVYTGDTRPVEATVAAAEGADLLVHDATFGDEDADRAEQTAHSTARGAGEVAARAGARRLALTHISSRYAGRTGSLAAEAADAFGGAVVEPHGAVDDPAEPGERTAFVANDGLTVTVPYPET